MTAPDALQQTAPHVPYRLDGKVALVTGSGRGIGAAMAIELGRCGAKVVVNYANSKSAAEMVVAEIKKLGSDAVAIQANVAVVAETTKLMDEAINHFGGLDIVCSNAGVVSFGHLGDVTEVYLSSSAVASSLSEGLYDTDPLAQNRRSSTASSPSTRAGSSSSPARPTAT